MKSIQLFSALVVMACAYAANASLVGLWRFEGDFTDASGQGNDGTPVNGVALAAGQAGFGQAASFSGADTHVLVPHHPSLDMTSAMTIAAWLQPDGTSWEGVLAKSPSSNGSADNHAGNYELRLASGSQNVQFLYQRGAVNDTLTLDGGAPTAVPSDPAWTHLAVTMDGSNVRFYLGGALVNTVAAGAGFGATNTNPLYLGSRADLFTDFHGLMDDVAVFDEVLSESQIRTIGTGDFSAFVVPEPGVLMLMGPGLAGLLVLLRRKG